MSSFAEKMVFYSAFHQEKRNVWTHVTFVPVITYSFFLMLSFIDMFTVGGFTFTAAMFIAALLLAYYFTLDVLFASAATVLFAVLLYAAEATTALGMQTCWIIFAACQIIGWGAQIYAHYGFEGSKPAFLDNVQQALVSAPIFVIADVFFHFGFKQDKREEVRQQLLSEGRLREDSVLNA